MPRSGDERRAYLDGGIVTAGALQPRLKPGIASAVRRDGPFGQQLLAVPRALAAPARTPSPAPPRPQRAPTLAATAPEGNALRLVTRSFRPSGWFPPQLRL